MRALLFSLLLLAAAPAAAQTAPAASLIEASNAGGVFEPLPSDSTIVVRHAGSGLVCRLPPGAANRLVIYPQAARGEDVSCDSNDGRVFLTLYATRYSFETTLDEQVAGAANAIRHRYPGAVALPGAAISAEAGVPTQTARFLVMREGVQMYSRASVAQIGQWVIKLRYSAPAIDAAAATQADEVAAALWRATLQEIVAEHS